MEKLIYYFSGTGNSLRTARIYADLMKNEETVVPKTATFIKIWKEKRGRNK